MLELREMHSTPSLPLLPDPLKPGVVASDRVLSMGRIELNCVLILNWIVWNRTVLTFNCLETKNYTHKLVKLATVVEEDPKAPFSIATPLRYRERYFSFPWIAPLYSWSIPYNAECQARRYRVPFFESLVWLNLGLKLGPLANTLTTRPMDQSILILNSIIWNFYQNDLIRC